MSKGLPKRELKNLTAFAEKLAIKAGKILARGFTQSFRVSFKGRIDPVTEYDLKSEKCIAEQIARTYPEHAILTEEGSAVGVQSAYRWVVDPLDGTVNYSHGFPFYCVSIGLEYNGEPILGVVYDPERRELFTAASGQGAFLNGKRIHVSSQRNLERALLATGFAYDIATARRNNLGLFSRMAKIAQGIRRPGSAAMDLCWLAIGRIDGFWELDLKPWDTAAATVIVREAGGKISRLNGQKFSITDRDLLASNGCLHRPMKEVLAG